MRFRLQTINNICGRLGIINEIERLPTFQMETPNLLFYTNGGCIPHLTHDVILMLTSDVLPLQIPLDNIYHATEAIIKLDVSVNTFIGLPEYLSFCTLQDPTTTVKQGYHKENVATIWSKHGKQFITKARHMELMESLKPDMYISLCDGDTNINSSKKRILNSARTTNEAFRYCYDQHVSSPTLCKKALIAPIEGGYDLTTRELCAKYLSNFPVVGYLIDGLYSDGASVHKIPFHSVEKIIDHTLKYIPVERLRIIQGAWEPQSILKMIKLGVDLFDTSFPCLNAENGCALVFNFNVENLFSENVQLVNLYHSKNENNIWKKELNNKNEYKSNSCVSNRDNKLNENNKISDGVQFKNNVNDEQNNTSKKNFVSPYSISLYDTKYFDDFTPIIENCLCLTCRKHTKAYVHHLLITKELLGMVLLMIHNLHHYMEFFRYIREHLRRNIGKCD
ncbi:hypothetical protein PGB90_001395 [Kerria lacca]